MSEGLSGRPDETGERPDVEAVRTSAALWKPNTACASGHAIHNSSDAVVTNVASFTSGTRYDATTWLTPVSGGATDYSALTHKPTLGTSAAHSATDFTATTAAIRTRRWRHTEQKLL